MRSETDSTKVRLVSTTKARAPGKIILSGEQFVVLGAPAVAMAISLYSDVEVKHNGPGGVQISANVPLKFLRGSALARAVPISDALLDPLRIAAQATLNHINKTGEQVDVNVDCGIPIAAGLGSSASTTVAMISAVSRSQGVELGRKEIFKLAFIPERFLHGNPSGVDQATCIYGGTIQFKRPATIRPVRMKTDPVLLICDTGIHHETRTLVGSVVRKSRKQKSHFRNYVSQVQEISAGVVKALVHGDREDLGCLMTMNHELLREIGVSHPKLDRLVAVAKRAGALGAKLTGAGGGGCLIAVCSSEKSREKITRALRKEGGIPFSISRDLRGVRDRFN